MLHHLLTIDDLSDTEVGRILHRAQCIRDGQARGSSVSARLVGLAFLQASLRTRFGFEVACKKLGWQTVVAQERRSADSILESVEDTVRVVAGMVDLVVARLPQPIASVMTDMPIPLINGGDAGASAEHPTQALIDVFAIQAELGDVSRLHVAVCGDMRFRTTRSILRLLQRRPPARLSVITVPDLVDRASAVRPEQRRTLGEVSDVDVLYVTGIPHQAIPEDVRDTLRVTANTMLELPAHAIVLSPLPVIDEIDQAARRDPRVKMFSQSDTGVFVRMAILEEVAAKNRT